MTILDRLRPAPPPEPEPDPGPPPPPPGAARVRRFAALDVTGLDPQARQRERAALAAGLALEATGDGCDAEALIWAVLALVERS